MSGDQPGAARGVRRRVAAVLTVVCALVLSGCTLLPAPTVTSTPVTGTVPAALRPFYTQRLVWRSCGNGLQCATASAPLDWARPSAGTPIRLALIRLPASGSRLGSLFVNPGGPGASGVDFVRRSATDFFDPALRERYDLVSWDPRGVGASSAVDCEDTAGLDEFLFSDPNEPAGSRILKRELTEDAVDFGRACAERTGALLAHVDTASTVADLDMLRAGVGDAKLNYFGLSYGTQIGAEYADRFPTRVGRMVLDGIVDPSLTEFQQNLADEKSFGAALTTYLASAQGGSAPPFPGSTVQQAIDTIADLILHVRRSPLRTSDGRQLNGAYLQYAITAALYDPSAWPYLTKALTEIQRGETVTTMALADSYVSRSNGRYTGNTFEAIFAVKCLDLPAEKDPAVLQKQAAQLLAADPLRGADNSAALGNVVCANWPVPPTGRPHRVRAAGAPPILVIGTTGDPATPYPWAVSVAKQLESGVLITDTGEGHTAYRNHDPCITTPVDAFFTAGRVPAAGLTC